MMKPSWKMSCSLYIDSCQKFAKKSWVSGISESEICELQLAHVWENNESVYSECETYLIVQFPFKNHTTNHLTFTREWFSAVSFHGLIWFFAISIFAPSHNFVPRNCRAITIENWIKLIALPRHLNFVRTLMDVFKNECNLIISIVIVM